MGAAELNRRRRLVRSACWNDSWMVLADGREIFVSRARLALDQDTAILTDTRGVEHEVGLADVVRVVR